jgi:phosphoserine aminotransferase
MPFTAEELKQAIAVCDTEAAKAFPEKKPSDPYFFVGPTPMSEELYKQLFNEEALNAWVEKRYGKTLRDLTQRSFRSEVAVLEGGIIPEMYRAVHQALQLTNQHVLTQVNGGGHQAGVTIIDNMIGIDPNAEGNQNVFVDSARGGAFRHGLTERQVKKAIKRSYEAQMKSGISRATDAENWDEVKRLNEALRNKEYKNHLVNHGNGRTLPTAEELEAAGVKYFFGTANETSTADAYSEKDWEQLRTWKEKDPQNRFIVLDITSAIGAVPLSKYWDIIDAAFFPPQKALHAPSETGFIVMSENAIAHMESDKVPGLSIPEHIFDKNRGAGANEKPRLLKRTHMFEPQNPRKPVQVFNSINLSKFAQTTIATEDYIQHGGEAASLENGAQCYGILENWIAERPDRFAMYTDTENRSLSVGLIDIIDHHFLRLAPAQQDAVLKKFHDMMGDQGADALNVAYDIKTFPTTPLPNHRKGQREDDKQRGIRFWLNVEPEKLATMLQWIEPVYMRALGAVLKEELAREKGKQEMLPLPLPKPSAPISIVRSRHQMQPKPDGSQLVVSPTFSAAVEKKKLENIPSSEAKAPGSAAARLRRIKVQGSAVFERGGADRGHSGVQ